MYQNKVFVPQINVSSLNKHPCLIQKKYRILQGKRLSTTAVQLDSFLFVYVGFLSCRMQNHWMKDQLMIHIYRSIIEPYSLLFLEDVVLTKLFVFGLQTPRRWRWPRRTPKAEGTSLRASLHSVRRQPALQHSARRHRCHFQRPLRQERPTSQRQRDRQVQRWADLCITTRV